MKETSNILFTQSDIHQRVLSLALELNKDYENKSVIILSILKGAFIFTADLVRLLNFPLTVEFMKISSYEGTKSSGKISLDFSSSKNFEGNHVLVLEDISDTGKTVQFLKEFMENKNTASLEFCTLFKRANKCKEEIKYYGFNIEDDAFIVGYGLDYNQKYRNLAHIAELTF